MIKLNIENSLLYIYHTKVLNNKPKLDVQLSDIANLINENFKSSIKETVDYLIEIGLLKKNYRLSSNISYENYKKLKDIIDKDWVKSSKGTMITKDGYALTSYLTLRKISYNKKVEGTITTSESEVCSLPRLVYETFNTEGVKYDDIYSIGFKDGNNTNNSFDNLVLNELIDTNADLILDEFDEVLKPHKLYFVLLSSKFTNTLFCKIGITKHDVNIRFNNENVDVVRSIEFDFDNGVLARGYESLLLERVIPKSYKFLPSFIDLKGGRSECFLPQYYESILKELNKKLK